MLNKFYACSYFCVLQYASVAKGNDRFMTSVDFVCGYLGLFRDGEHSETAVTMLANCVDTTKDG